MKKIFILGMAMAVLIMAVGCKADITGDGDTVSNENNGDNALIPVDETDDGYYVSPTDDVPVGESITVGEIMVFDGEYIHIISGDLVQVYEYDSSQEKDFYLGQTVSLIKGEEADYLEQFIIDDFSTHYTNMGHLLTGVTGEITKITDSEIAVKSGDEEVSVSTYEALDLAEGTNATLYYMSFSEGEQPSLVMIFNEDTKLNLTVTAINRGENGEMLLSMTDADGGEYEVSASSCILEVNLSEISVGDELAVYHEGIMESWPMQLMTTLISQ